MNVLQRWLSLALISLFILFLALNCSGEHDKGGSDARKASQVDLDWDHIVERGVIRAITSYSPVSYFIYRGQPMGYEYELLNIFAERHGLEMEILVARDLDEMIDMLNRGEGDLISYGLTITRDRRDIVNFTIPFNTTRQVLVQRKPDGWRQMRLHEIERTLLRSPIELADETIVVRRASSYLDRLENLQNEIGADINVLEAEPGFTTEQLIRMVAEREIDFTISDENIARLNQAYFPILDIETPVSLPQQTAWAVRNTSPELLGAINEWLEEYQRDSEYYVIYNKYFENTRAYRSRLSSQLLFSEGGQISTYDDIIQEHAEKIGWDWKLLAALIYQESQFNPNASSWAGAVGLMQLMPRTAQAYGANDPTDPRESIEAGVRFIEWLQDYWEDEIEDPDERQKFVIASYNVGQGHVQDARRLAAYFGADPDVWDDNVAVYLEKKSYEDYYNHEVVRYGYARGVEPVRYVNSIMYIYQHYRAIANLRIPVPEEDPIVLD
ncbi:MAG: transporter substrate-binding domain-containing protein [Balneolia bacterium]|nr:transporter substrate-binding domain-containing protein [Balneolia bacterium]